MKRYVRSLLISLLVVVAGGGARAVCDGDNPCYDPGNPPTKCDHWNCDICSYVFMPVCDANGDGSAESCYLCDADYDGEAESCYLCDGNGDGKADSCFLCDGNFDGLAESCYLCDSDEDKKADKCYLCDADFDSKKESCYLCDSNENNIPDKCYLCDHDGDSVKESCYQCDLNGNGKKDSCYLCDHNKDGIKEACPKCDTDGNGIADSCYLCDANGDGREESCYLCDANLDGTADSCYVCDNNGDGKYDSCYSCDTDNDGKYDSCMVCDSNGDGKNDSCYTCDGNGDGKNDTCYLCDNNGDGKQDSCYACDSNGDGKNDSCYATDSNGDGIKDTCPCIESGYFQMCTWECASPGSISNARLDPATPVEFYICVGEGLSLPTILADLAGGSKQCINGVNTLVCPSSPHYGENPNLGTAPVSYTLNTWWEPSVPSTFDTPGTFTFTAKAKGVDGPCYDTSTLVAGQIKVHVVKVDVISISPRDVELGQDVTVSYGILPDDAGAESAALEIRNSSYALVYSAAAEAGSGLHSVTWPATKWNQSPHAGAFANPLNNAYSIRVMAKKAGSFECRSEAETVNTKLVIEADIKDTKPTGSTATRSAGLEDMLDALRIVLIDGSGVETSFMGTDITVTGSTPEDKHITVQKTTLNSLPSDTYNVQFRYLRDEIGNFSDKNNDPDDGIQPIEYDLELR